VSKHTPGPWVIDPCHDGWQLLANGSNVTAAPFDCSDEDARLMAAAPELLASLRATVELLSAASDSGSLYGTFDVRWRELLDSVRLVIERAEGGKR
jgi:hypothetical protein